MLNGEEALSQSISEAYREEIEVARRLVRFAKVMLPERTITYTGPGGEFVVPVVLALMAMALKVFRGIQRMVENGLIEPAMMLLRPLADVLASIGYIAADPAKRADRAELYLAGEVTEYYKWVKSIIAESASQLLPPEVAANPEALLETLKRNLIAEEAQVRGEPGSKERAERRLQDMVRRQGWADVSTEAMFEEARAKSAYPLVYKMASGIMHARRPGMYVSMADDGSTIVSFEANDRNLDLVLFVSNLLFAGILAAVNEIFGLSHKKAIDEFIDTTQTLAKKRKEARDRDAG